MKRTLVTISVFLLAEALHAQTPVVTSVNNESGSGSLCPGGIAFVHGTNLGGTGTAVTVGTMQAYVLNAFGGTSLQIELPVGAPLGATTLKAGASAPFNITLVPYAPGVATDGQADNLAVAYHYPSQTPLRTGYPAAPNEQVAIVATGLGLTNPVFATGTAPNDTSAVAVTMPTVHVAATAVTPSATFLEPGSPGFYLVVFNVPGGAAAGNLNINVSIGGLNSNTAVLPVATGPIIGGVAGAASYINETLPNGPIAQGSIFIIGGNNLGPATLSIAPNPFQTTNWGGTSVSVTIGGTTVSAPMYYTSATQVAALMPSNTPAGTGTISATYNGQPGPPHPITVVASEMGIFTVTSDGQGAGIVTYPDYSLVSTVRASNCGGVDTNCGAANPNDVLIIWATGLGPISGGTDSSGAGLAVNMPSIPLTIWLGGVSIKASYQGRSGCCVGEDQIVFTVPANAPTGCAVPLSLQIGNYISNVVTMPVAAAGSRTCTPTNPAFTPANVTQLANLGSSTVSYGEIDLKRSDNYPGFTDKLKGQFLSFTVPVVDQPYFLSYVDSPAMGTCQVYNNLNGSNPPLTIVAGLDAGPQLTVQGPNGSKSLAGSGGGYGGTLSAGGTFLSPGTYTVTASGGANVTNVNASITLPTLPTMTSPPPDSVNPFVVTRSNGLTVTWTAGTANEFIELDGFSATDNTYTIGSSFTCIAPATAGTFTIPPSVLLTMPAGPFAGMDFHPTTLPTNFTGTGLTVTQLLAQFDYYTPLTFQ